MSNKKLSLNDIVKDTSIDKTVLKQVFLLYKIEPIVEGEFGKHLYNYNEIEGVIKSILERYEFNKKNRIPRHEFIARMGPVASITKLPKFRTEIIDRVFEFKGCRFIYCREAAEGILAINNNQKENELLNLKSAVNYLEMASYKAGLKLIKTSDLKPISAIDNSSIYYLKADIEKLKEQIQRKLIENTEKYYTLYDLRELELKGSEINQLKSIPLQPIDKVKQFKNCSVVYLKSVVDKLIENQRMKQNDLLLKEQFYKDLGLGSTHKLEVILNEHNIKGKKIGGFIYYKKIDIETLKQHILKKYKYNRENCYLSNEVLEKGISAYQLQSLEPYKLKAEEKVFDFIQHKVVYKKSEIDTLLEEKEILQDLKYYTLVEIQKIYPFEGKVKTLLRKNNLLPVIKANTGSLWSKAVIDEFIEQITQKVEWLDLEFLTIKEAEIELNISHQTMNNYFIKYGLMNNYYEIPQEIKVGKYLNSSKLISRESVANLKTILETEAHEREVHRQKVQRELELNRKIKMTLQATRVKESCIENDEVMDFLKRDENKLFVKEVTAELNIDTKNILNNLKSYDSFKLEDSHFIAKRDLAAYYELGNLIVNYVIQKIKHCVYKTTLFFYKSDVSRLLEDIEKAKQSFFKEYYTNSEYLELGGTSHELRKLQNYEVPREFRTGKYQNTIYVYLKSDCEKFLAERKTNEVVEKYGAELNSDLRIDKLFLECLVELNINFESKQKITHESWSDFVRKKLLSSKTSLVNLRKLFKKFINITKVLIEAFTEDITEVKTAKVASVLLNSKVSFSYRVEIYIWLKTVYHNHQVEFNYKRLPNLHELNRSQSDDSLTEQPAYTESEFLALLDFVVKVDLHKKRVFEELESPKNYRRKYYAYESVWLYVMLHLNNGWRGQSFIDTIPRITLPEHLDSFEKFKNVELSINDAQKIVWELTSNLVNIQHAKNDKKNFFFCSEDLLYPLANALILCELKCRLNNLDTNQLIYLDKNNNLSRTLNNDFFKDFSIESFQFKTLRANHTFIKFSNLIFNQVLKNVMGVSKYIRNHTSYDTTNVYIDIDEEHLNRITRQLFNVNYFGYSYAIFKNYLTNKALYIPNRMTHADVIEELKMIFGDVMKIENLAVQINSIEKNYTSLFLYLDALNSDEIIELDNLIRLQQLPAKESHFQCLLGDCIYEGQMNVSCSKCPFAIPNFYALTKITKDALGLIEKFEKITAKNRMGEKTHIANLLYRNLKLIAEAKAKYGENIIASFLGIDYSQLLKKIKELDDIYPYLTIVKENSKVEG